MGRSVSLLPFVVFQLQQRKVEKELCFLDFRTKIKGLWERLQVPQEDREAFSDHMVESKKRNMEAVRKLPQLCSLGTTERVYSNFFCLSSCRRSFSVWSC